MAPPLSYSKFIAALKAEGLIVVEHETNGKSPKYHNRNSVGKWGPVHGVMIHHTVTSGHDNTIEICRRGYSGLPGPLCQGVICKQGHVHVVGYGRCNHAGLGDDDVLDAVIAEKKIPVDNEANTDGNARYYGFECENKGDGKDPWPDVQVESIVRASAALCRAHQWNVNGEGEESVIGHKEWQPGKVDPRGIEGDMAGIRDRVEDRLQHDSDWSPGDATTPPPAPKPEKPKPAPKPATPKYQPFPGAAWFKKNPNSPIVTAMGKRLVAEKCSRYNVGPGPKWTKVDRESYKRWQRKCGFYGSAADGWPGKISWDRLKVPFVK
jgi:hypothetical protein